MGNIIDDVKSGNLAKVEEILKRDPSLSNSKDGIFTDHWSALHWAAHFNHKDICRVLIENGANIYLLSKNKETALHIASFQGHTEVCSVLVDKAGDRSMFLLGLSNVRGETALNVAAYQGHIHVCSFLIANGALTNQEGKDALYQAASMGHKELCRLLIGIDDWTSFQKCVEYCCNKVCLLLRLPKNAGDKYLERVDRQLSRFRLQLKDPIKDEWSALQDAARNGWREMCQFLVENPSQPNYEENSTLDDTKYVFYEKDLPIPTAPEAHLHNFKAHKTELADMPC